MQNVLMAEEALSYVLSRFSFTTVLDVGSGQGLHADRFRAAGKAVVTLDSSDHWGKPDVMVPFEDFHPAEKFDLVWCSHVLEHQLNVNLFLRQVFGLLKPGGIFAISVPPLKTSIVGGHVTVWNAGLLAYNLVMAGFDCRELAIKAYGYNISAIGRKRHAALPPVHMDAGDIERLACYFPFPVRQDFDGNIGLANWRDSPDLRPLAGPALSASQVADAHFGQVPTPFDSDLQSFEWALAAISIPGVMVEIGASSAPVRQIMRRAVPVRPLHGFDLVGVPEIPPEFKDLGLDMPDLGGPPKRNLTAEGVLVGPIGDTLPIWAEVNGANQIACLHLGGQLGLTSFVLDVLDVRLQAGSVLVFEEFEDWNDPDATRSERALLAKWMADHGRRLRFLCRGPERAAAFVVEDRRG